MTVRLTTLLAFLVLAAGLRAQVQGTTGLAPVPAISFKAERINGDLNSSQADFAPFRYGDRLYFTSLRENDTQGARLYSCLPGQEPRVDAEFDIEKLGIQVACPAFMPDASQMFFTICQDLGMQQCELWCRRHEYEGTWSPPIKLPDHLNLPGSNATQPTVGWDIPRRTYVLFFASDRPGGQGGMDIWSCTIDHAGRYGEPVCMPFNTPKDEVTPFFDQTTQTLYFSSNGLGGLGRFDIFSSQNDPRKGWTTPSNLPKPFNSSYDDLSYSLHEATQISYLASDRPGSLCDNGNVDGFPCFDLYEIRRAVPAADMAQPTFYRN